MHRQDNRETTSQNLVPSEEFEKVLVSIGYKLIDCGDHWRSQALYRNGNNATALKIYKNTGVWMDFVEPKGSLPFETLARMTVGDSEKFSEILKKIKSDKTYVATKVDKIEMEQCYPEDCLDKFFPNYKFYKDKGISEETQISFKVGLAGVGKMYRRMVFPIYNDNGQIIGFSGRKIDEDNDYPKWKHVGKKNTWVYPAHVPENECNAEIDRSRQVILVESVGDAMALYDQGIKNVLVLFGLSASSNIINYLSSKALDNVYISTNNDLNSSRNRGLIAAIKNYLKLAKYFDLNALTIKLPQNGNDFGEMYKTGYNINNWLNRQISQEEQRDYIYNFVSKNSNLFNKVESEMSQKLK
jgi:hypothetical protein